MNDEGFGRSKTTTNIVLIHQMVLHNQRTSNITQSWRDLITLDKKGMGYKKMVNVFGIVMANGL